MVIGLSSATPAENVAGETVTTSGSVVVKDQVYGSTRMPPVRSVRPASIWAVKVMPPGNCGSGRKMKMLVSIHSPWPGTAGSRVNGDGRSPSTSSGTTGRLKTMVIGLPGLTSLDQGSGNTWDTSRLPTVRNSIEIGSVSARPADERASTMIFIW